MLVLATMLFGQNGFSQDHDPSKILGQDNILRYRPHRKMVLRIQDQDKPLDIIRSIAAALSCAVKLTISWTQKQASMHLKDELHSFIDVFSFIQESEEEFNQQVEAGVYLRVRLMSPASESLIKAASKSAIFLDSTPVLSHGRFELLHYLREISFSMDYHRYGNLGLREKEERKPVR